MPMTSDELRSLYTEAVKIARAEKKMRLFVFRDNPARLKAKIGEMDKLLYILEQLKDALKPHCEPDYEQEALIDVPRKGEYP